MRKMATVRRIDEIRAIEGADSIEVAVVGGWNVVVKKNEFKAGDLAVYCEVDSFIPTAIAPFLTKPGHFPKEYNGVEGERLRTVKLRGQLSQGLLLPTTFKTLFEGQEVINDVSASDEGADVSEIFGIVKWEPPVSAQIAGLAKGSFPSAVPKTDEERIQNLTKQWPTLKTYQYEVTEKLEGSSMTAGRIDGEFVVCSRNLSLKETVENSMWVQARRYNLEQNMIEQGLDNLVVQGEIIGEGIQGNHYGIKGQDFYVFSVYDIQAGTYLHPAARRELCANLGLKHVPVLEEAGVFPVEASVEDILVAADGYSKLNPQKLREGVVFKRVFGEEHFKAVSNKYLLKTGG
jgi:RNA ligase (TIGR02306 family)